jgi:hypothetical protein
MEDIKCVGEGLGVQSSTLEIFEVTKEDPSQYYLSSLTSTEYLNDSLEYS